MKTMKTLPVMASLVAAMLLTANLVWAAEAPAPAAPAAAPVQATGKVRAIDPVNLVIKMEGGDFYLVPASINLADFKEGDQIVLSGEKDAFGRLQVKSVTKKK